MSRSTAVSRKRRQIAPYWYVIILLLAVTAAIYIYHLSTANTPSRVAIHIEFLDFDIFWYGIWIVGGIALGSWVVANLARERGQKVFSQTVPYKVRRQPLTSLNFPEDINQTLNKQQYETVGDLLLPWGFDRRGTGLNKAQIAAVEEILKSSSMIQPAWVEDAPWRIWNPDNVWNGIVWLLIFGVIGARLYHVLTPSPSMAAVGIHSPLDYFRNPYQLINFRNGGLGIYGALAGGALGLFIYTRRARIPMLGWADLAVVGLALGQVFGRWGNFFNQELYGSPTELPWAVHIAPAYRLPEFSEIERFHPAFLYESLWSLLTFFVLYFLVKRFSERLLTGELTALYLIFYAIGRTLLEQVRLDSRTVTFGTFESDMAVATLVSIVVALFAAAWVISRRLRQRAT
ncbi:MAG: prolipoprotein diacylglyceryl transferase [Candidatus Promineifilaceae bacterium]|nr:prolipoprotein diacylglyceryl transferase [Candidatus Promineifilaceae bacterium]